MIPVGDSPKSRSTPWVTYLFIAMNFAMWLRVLMLDDSLPAARPEQQAQFAAQTQQHCYGLQVPPTELEEWYCRFSFQPHEFFDNARDELEFPVASRTEIWLSIVVAMFMHAGWVHILGNMLYLWVFGDNVEDRFGHIGFILFYLAGGIFAFLAQALIDTQSVVPIVGASGAVAGVLGAYIVMYPRATVSVIIPFFILVFIPLPIPALLMIGFWFLQNLFAGALSIVNETDVGGGVAFFAHIGGFVFGMLAAMLLGRRRRAAPRWRG